MLRFIAISLTLFASACASTGAPFHATGYSAGGSSARIAHAQNYGACLQSRPECQWQKLSPVEQAQISSARNTPRAASSTFSALATPARDPNYDACLTGADACDLNTLSPEQLQALVTARTNAVRNSPAGVRPSTAPYPATVATRCAENGSCYGDISPRTGRPRTVPVRGYYRRDGTYVRGHYRSPPRRRR